ncbi:MAG: DUF3037 domain-containing protein [Pseudomonadota bacterium]|uniref:DUF3037 domain-containing protein n=1 Tax=Gallaecimonas pentaromativorans TaxID=584787 RepID=UPI00067ECFB7|nr:DUF3037 domain-containing protein [Gallaecimonas pentaromativorans]MED5523450.1 DUF3037 domain-containing protein [Pseudomonadota bacterium]
MKEFKYSIVRLTPDEHRGEIINVGLIVFRDQAADVRLLDSTSKIKFFDSTVTLSDLDSFSENLEWFASSINDPELVATAFSGSMTITRPGVFHAEGEAEYEVIVGNLMAAYVNPLKKRSGIYRKRIVTELKDIFRGKGILGKDESDLLDHKIIPKFPISEDEGLFAELLLKNGKYHITETLDLRGDNKRIITGDSALKAITINRAKKIFQGNVYSFIVYAAQSLSQEREAITQLRLLENDADRLVNLYSKDDMSSYYDYMLKAAGQNIKGLSH